MDTCIPPIFPNDSLDDVPFELSKMAYPNPNHIPLDVPAQKHQK